MNTPTQEYFWMQDDRCSGAWLSGAGFNLSPITFITLAEPGLGEL